MITTQRKLKRWELYQKEWQIPELRTDEPVGLYPRQSTKRQLKNNRQSFEKQSIDAIDDLFKRGWTQVLIHIYDQDNGRSAARALEDKEALNQMLADIRAKRIRTVRVGEVDRLFRDEDRIDSNVFIKICKEADCLVLTDRALYDFNIPRHVDYFRDEVDRAWKFYELQILIRAHEMQDRARSQGLYTGGAVLVGYIIDKNPKSPTYKKYIPYQPHSQRGLEIFQWLYDCGGILGILENRLDKLPYIFPHEEQWVRDQKAFATNLQVVYGAELDEDGSLMPIGYRFSREGLKDYLRNRHLIGDWKHDDDWIPNNHQPIIPRDLWNFAQDALDRHKAADVRSYHKATPSIVYDILYAGTEKTTKRFVTRRVDKGNYCIMEQKGFRQKMIASINIDELEGIFLEKYRERLRDTKRFENYEERLVGQEQQITERRQNLHDAIKELTSQIDGLFLTLKSPKLDARQRGDFLEERGKLKRRREALQQELAVQTPLQVYIKYKDLIELMGKYWERYPYEDRQALVALLVKRVCLEYLSPRFMQITIVWKEFPPDVGIIQRANACSFRWTPQEDQIIRELYPTASPQTLLDILPHRSWDGIRSRALEINVHQERQREHVPYRNVSKEDLQVAERYDIPREDLVRAGKSFFVRWRLRHHWPPRVSGADS
jgi:hypothetical protein